jgi:hypothetical protein
MFLERARVLWEGEGAASNALAREILDPRAPVVRQLKFIGYDRISGCYAFPTHMIDRHGNFIRCDEKEFFKVSQKEFIRPVACSKAICPSDGHYVQRFYDLLTAAWGENGALGMAWTIASFFVNQIKQQTGFFPFLSFHGDPQTGKSHLTRTLNAFQCLEEEGIPMRRSNTSKGEIRKIGEHSGNFVALLEWPTNGQARFDLDNILTLYNVNPLQIRAMKTNDTQTHEIPFYGALMFVQNVEPFQTKPQKERVISCKFTTDNLTAESLEAFQELEAISLADKASFFVSVMSQRAVFENNWRAEYRAACLELNECGLTSRICENYGLVLAFHRLFCQVFGIDRDLYPHIQNKAAEKQAQCSTIPETIADHFIDIVIQLGRDNLGEDFVDYSEDRLWINKVEALKAIKNEGYSTGFSDKELIESLKAHPAYIGRKAHRFNGESKKAYEFNMGILGQGIGIAEATETAEAA